MQSVSRGKKTECRRKEGGRERAGKPWVVFLWYSLFQFLPVFLFHSFSFCCSTLTGLVTGFTGGTAPDHIWLSFSPSLHFCLCLVLSSPRSTLGGHFCVNYKESGGERSEAAFLCFFFFPSLSVRDLYSFPSNPSCRCHLFCTLNLGKAHGGGSLCLMIMIISYPALSTTMYVEPTLMQPIYAAIDLLSLYVLFSEYRSCDNTLEKFLSNFVLFMGICMYNLWKDKGSSSLGTSTGKQNIQAKEVYSHGSPVEA